MKKVFLLIVCVALSSCGSKNGERKNGLNSTVTGMVKKAKKPVLSIDADELIITTSDNTINLKVEKFDEEKGELIFEKLTDAQRLELLKEKKIIVEYRISGLKLYENLTLENSIVRDRVSNKEINSSGERSVIEYKGDDVAHFVGKKPGFRIQEVTFVTDVNEMINVIYPRIGECSFGKIDSAPSEDCKNNRVIMRDKVQAKTPVLVNENIKINVTYIPSKLSNIFTGGLNLKKLNISGEYRMIKEWKYSNIESVIESVEPYFYEQTGNKEVNNDYKILKRYVYRNFISRSKESARVVNVGLITPVSVDGQVMSIHLSNGNKPEMTNYFYKEDYQLKTDVILLED
ncbi:hypothetical protein [Bacteriovorax sp. Seq25_V]|uniref:hypothetical protein n=1 Tax=Bacteriovorax sp. Seq25_V TaxID=1201288 RepID=UPI000389FCF5|nr:hypothetical protein [Bacteriovorax sp. Seq25_V]EQC43222.1 putative lipoprotein [Bacteriovorax sp. Seq25_V]